MVAPTDERHDGNTASDVRHAEDTASDAAGTVSVVVPTYYRNERLRAALESVAAQTYPAVDVVVVDCSTDGHARPVVADFDATYVLVERDDGPQAARSLGAERATGDYVQFLDDDDRLAPTKLERQVPLLADDTGVAYCGIVDEDRGEILPSPDVRGNVVQAALEMRTFPCINSTMLVDADVLADLLPLAHRHGADDTGTKIDLALRTEFDYVPEALVYRGRTDTSLSDSWAYVEGRKAVVEYFADVYDQFPPSVRRRAIRETHYVAARKHLEERAWSPAAIAEFARAAYHTPDRRARYATALVASLFGRAAVHAIDGLFVP